MERTRPTHNFLAGHALAKAREKERKREMIGPRDDPRTLIMGEAPKIRGRNPKNRTERAQGKNPSSPQKILATLFCLSFFCSANGARRGHALFVCAKHARSTLFFSLSRAIVTDNAVRGKKSTQHFPTKREPAGSLFIHSFFFVSQRRYRQTRTLTPLTHPRQQTTTTTRPAGCRKQFDRRRHGPRYVACPLGPPRGRR